jgi:hypothetical protein
MKDEPEKKPFACTCPDIAATQAKYMSDCEAVVPSEVGNFCSRCKRQTILCHICGGFRHIPDSVEE